MEPRQEEHDKWTRLVQDSKNQALSRPDKEQDDKMQITHNQKTKQVLESPKIRKIRQKTKQTSQKLPRNNNTTYTKNEKRNKNDYFLEC